VAPNNDRNLVNPWGLVPNAMGVFWIANEATGTSTLYDGDGNTVPLVVDVPSPSAAIGGAPTGIVLNTTSSFPVSDGSSTSPAVFLFAGADGVISGWNPALPPPPPSNQAEMVIDNSAADAVYLGLAIASTGAGDRLYAANFHSGEVEVYDGAYNPVNVPGAFVDATLPDGYSPFNVMVLAGKVYVTYAKKEIDEDEELLGAGLGWLSVFDTNGILLSSLIKHGRLNAPWGMAIAPANFGLFSNALLVANFGDGRINAFDVDTGQYLGTLRRQTGSPIHVTGMWGIAFGTGTGSSPSNVLYFVAGPGDETHGVFGRVTAF
jgi:uncharacterized protein (TIGR03118 family)